MEEKDFVTLEVAKLLREKGFKEGCIAYYDNGSSLSYIGSLQGCNINNILESSKYITSESIFPAPTLYQAQKWLREKHNCYVQVTHEAYKTGVNNLVQVLFYDTDSEYPNDCWTNDSTGMYGDNSEFNTYEDALNFGILKALERI
jgi:hypothetical protein